MSKRKMLISIITSLIIILVSFGSMQFLGSFKELPKKKEQVKTYKKVKTQRAVYQTVMTSIELYGRVKNNEPIDIIAEVQGKVEKGDIALNEGLNFNTGQVLFRITDPQPTLQLSAKKSNFIRDIALILPDLKIDFTQSYETWYNYLNSIDVQKKLPPLPETNSPKEKVFLATKGIFFSYYDIRSDEASLKKRVVIADFPGSIIEVNFYNGSFVNSGSKVIKVIKNNNLELKVPVTIKDLKWVTTGKSVKIYSERGVSWMGRVSRIGDIFNDNTQSLDVFIRITPNKNKVYEGMYLKAVINDIEISDVMEVPREALVNDRQLYVLEDSSLKLYDIDVKKISSNSVIFNGLKQNAEFVVESITNTQTESTRVISLEQAKQSEKTSK